MPIDAEIVQEAYEQLHPKTEPVDAGGLELKHSAEGRRKLKARRKRSPKWFKWTVEFQVEKSWVADGFDLTDERAHSMLAHNLRFANNTELHARVISTPDVADIAHEQGYKTVRAYKEARKNS